MADKITKFLAHNEKISIVCIDTTELVEEARKIHDLSPLATAAFGRLLTITSIMAQEMKNKTDKITIQIKCNGEIGTMLTTATNEPKVKGYVANPYVDLPLNEFGKLDVGRSSRTRRIYQRNKRYRTKRPIHRNITTNIRRNSRRFY